MTLPFVEVVSVSDTTTVEPDFTWMVTTVEAGKLLMDAVTARPDRALVGLSAMMPVFTEYPGTVVGGSVVGSCALDEPPLQLQRATQHSTIAASRMTECYGASTSGGSHSSRRSHMAASLFANR